MTAVLRCGSMIAFLLLGACSSSGTAYDVHINQSGDPIEITVQPSETQSSALGASSRRLPVDVIVANNSDHDVTVTHIKLVPQRGIRETVNADVNDIVDAGKERKFPLMVDLQLTHDVPIGQRSESAYVLVRAFVTLSNGGVYFQDFEFRVDVQ